MQTRNVMYLGEKSDLEWGLKSVIVELAWQGSMGHRAGLQWNMGVIFRGLWGVFRILEEGYLL